MAWRKTRRRHETDEERIQRAALRRRAAPKAGDHVPVPKVKKPKKAKRVPRKADTPEPKVSKKTWLRKKRSK